MQNSDITFKGTVNGITLIMKESLEFNTILEQIERKLSAAGQFFNGASILVKYRGRKLTKEEEEKIVKILSEKSGAKIKSLEQDKDYNNIMSDEKKTDNPKSTKSDMTIKSKWNINFFEDIEEGMTKFYRGTVRSGQSIQFYGNVVVIGDVNPGGEIIATGNVIVMGSLRGTVHAGSDGNKDALVIAFNLNPTQLRIADVITRPPDERNVSKNQFYPELAFVKDNLVYIERYLPQLEVRGGK